MNNKLKAIAVLAKQICLEKGGIEMCIFLNNMEKEIWWRFKVPNRMYNGNRVFTEEEIVNCTYENKYTGKVDNGIRLCFYQIDKGIITCIELYER